MLYFAYGSNLDARTCKGRSPGARQVARGVLLNHRLTFAGASEGRGGGVADVQFHKGSNVCGLLWELSDGDFVSMDRAEGVPWLYRRKTVRVHGEDRRGVDAEVYVMVTPFPAAPAEGYFNLIREAYLRLGYNPQILQQAARGLR